VEFLEALLDEAPLNALIIAAPEPVSAYSRTGFRVSKTEIGKTRTETSAKKANGDGGEFALGSALSIRVNQSADYLAFLYDQLAMKVAPPGESRIIAPRSDQRPKVRLGENRKN
jgi:hypothetical protein